jgi:hypothetical protein
MKVIFTHETPHTRPGKTFKSGVEYVLDNSYANEFIKKGVAKESTGISDLLKEVKKSKPKK